LRFALFCFGTHGYSSHPGMERAGLRFAAS
jgi:hypothetical protein